MSEANISVDGLVMLECECGKSFKRPNEYVLKRDEYQRDFPSAARFYERKLKYCDDCHQKAITRALGTLPELMKALST